LTPTEGTVVWLGRDMADLRGEALRRERRNMQVIFQDPIASSIRADRGQAIERPLIISKPVSPAKTRRQRTGDDGAGGLPRAWSAAMPNSPAASVNASACAAP
jgi:ABC-type microcin C transport system duplicated ATPase subunit YejF